MASTGNRTKPKPLQALRSAYLSSMTPCIFSFGVQTQTVLVFFQILECFILFPISQLSHMSLLLRMFFFPHFTIWTLTHPQELFKCHFSSHTKNTSHYTTHISFYYFYSLELHLAFTELLQANHHPHSPLCANHPCTRPSTHNMVSFIEQKLTLLFCSMWYFWCLAPYLGGNKHSKTITEWISRWIREWINKYHLND